MKLSDVLKAALLSRLVGVEPLEACALAERRALLGSDPQGGPGQVAKAVGEYLAHNGCFRASSPYTAVGSTSIRSKSTPESPS